MTHEQYRFTSSVDVALTIDAPDWRTAMCVGLQLLERDEAVGRLELVPGHDRVFAVDPSTQERFTVIRLAGAIEQRQAA